jgi:hypothetical protein
VFPRVGIKGGFPAGGEGGGCGGRATRDASVGLDGLDLGGCAWGEGFGGAVEVVLDGFCGYGGS